MCSCARIVLVYKEFRRSRCQNTQHNTCIFLASYKTKITGTKNSLDLPWCIPSVISNTAGLLSYLPAHSVYISHTQPQPLSPITSSGLPGSPRCCALSRREFLAEQLSQLQCAQFSCWLCTHTAQLPPRSGTQAPTPVPLTKAQVSRQHPTVTIGSHPFSTSSSSIASAFPISLVWPWVSVLSYQTSLVSSTR